jgi:phosphate transport system permease protein
VISERVARRETVAASINARAPDTEAGFRARAGFEYWRAPPNAASCSSPMPAPSPSTKAWPAATRRSCAPPALAMRAWESLFRWSPPAPRWRWRWRADLGAQPHFRQFRARDRVEGASPLCCCCLGDRHPDHAGHCVLALFESIRFFASIDWRIHEFLFGLQWSPQIAIRADQVGQTGAFGAVPLFAGTALITVIAMLVAVPVGLFAAIYLSEYASPRFRAWAKPALEILAGVPTVVYGFFALLTVGPFLRDFALLLGYEDAVTQRPVGGSGDGGDDHPLRVLAVGRCDQRRAAIPARRRLRHGRDQVRGRAPGGAARRPARHCRRGAAGGVSRAVGRP